jgi:hypothetical protein
VKAIILTSLLIASLYSIEYLEMGLQPIVEVLIQLSIGVVLAMVLGLIKLSDLTQVLVKQETSK